MKFATFSVDGRRGVGIVDGTMLRELALDPAQAARGALPVIEMLVRGQALPDVVGESRPVRSVRLEAPIPAPFRNLWCVGRNYHAHAKELAQSVFVASPTKTDEWPIVFSKVPECVVGPYADVHMPGAEISDQIDYEAELTVVIGLGGKNIPRARAMEHVFGYTIVNDVTARDVQMRHQQWDLGKSFDTFCPMGPWIVTADALDGAKTHVRCWVNGELRQDSPTANMIFDVPTLIETVSRGITLHPGDIIATGTPAGVGMGMKPPRWLRSGDVVKIEIDGLGHIENRFV